MPSPRARRIVVVVLAAAALLALAALLLVRSLLDGDAVRSAVAAQAASALGRPVTVGSARAAIFPRVGLSLGDVAIGEPPAITAGRVEVSTGLGGLLRRRVEDAVVLASAVRVALPLPARDGKQAPPATGADEGEGNGAAGFTIASVREVRLEDLELTAAGRTLEASLRASLLGDRLELEYLRLRGAGSDLGGRATLTDWVAREGSFALEAKELDLDGLMAFAAAAGAPAGKGAATGKGTAAGKRQPAAAPPVLARKLTGTLSAAHGRSGAVEFRDLEAEVAVSGSRLVLEPLKLALYDGSYQGSLAVDLERRGQRVEYRGRLERVDIGRLGAALGAGDAAAGRLTASLQVSGGGATLEEALGRMRGSGQVTLLEGRLKHLDLVHAALTHLGAAAAEATGRAPVELSAGLAVGDGKLRTDDLVVTSADFDLRGKGTLALAGGLDLALELVLSAALSAGIKDPKWDYAREGGRLVLPVRVGGTVSKPTVTVDAAALAKRAAAKAGREITGKATEALRKKLFGK